jgi:signal recognition particle subunit SEC65
MRSRKPFIIFWPQYFDAKRSRSEGRRIPKKFAIDKINTNDIVKAAKHLGYDAHSEKGYQYPRTWWDDPYNQKNSYLSCTSSLLPITSSKLLKLQL